MQQPLKILISKLDNTCKTSLEQAVNLCMQYTHYNVELEHWLLTLIRNHNNAFTQMLHLAQCNVARIEQDILSSLERLKKGNDQNPALSQRIIDLIHEAWLLSSLQYDGEQIHSGMLLSALAQSHTLSQLLQAISNEFEKLQSADMNTLMQKALNMQTHSSADTSDESGSHTNKANTKTPALDQYTTNLNEQAKSGKIDEAIGRENEIRQVIDILARRRQNNAILTGEPGVGKTAIVEGFALRIVKGDVPDSLKEVVIHSLDLGLLQAGASVKGEFENRLKQLITDIKNAPYPIILFIDEAHTLIGAGGQSGQNDAANLLKPALARGELRSIAATTWAEYKQYFEKDAALTRRFQVVNVDEPNIPTAINMLRSLTPNLEQHHKIAILDEAVTLATTLSERYITARQLPDKSISVLDTACARVASKQTTTPAQLEANQKHLQQLNLELARLEQESLSQSQLDHRDRIKALKSDSQKLEKLNQQIDQQWQSEKKLVNQIIEFTQKLSNPKITPAKQKSLQKSLKATQAKLSKIQSETPFVQAAVDGHAVAEVIADWTGIPVGKMMKDQGQTVMQLDQTLAQNIIGQDHAITTISESIKTSAAKLSDPDKPIGVFLFVGPSGVGKTETANLLAENLFGSRDKMTVINMSEFKEEHKISMLAGSPPGYVGYGEGGVLTEAVRRKPYSLILLDEMEKAHPGLQDVFYQVFDKGIMKDGQGRDINFKNTLIIMTSNACSESITKLCENPEIQANPDLILDQIESELMRTFKPAFLGRIKIVPYLSLAPEILHKIIGLKLAKVVNRIKTQYNVDLKIDAKVIQHIQSLCQHHSIGARQIDNIINHMILPELSSLLLDTVLNDIKINQIMINMSKDKQFHFKARQLKKSHQSTL